MNEKAMNEKTDRRITRSQRAIQTAFLEMLEERDFDSITVKNITEKADISRKTFYLHYVDKFDLLNTIVNRHLGELQRICEGKKDKGFVEGTIIWFRYFDEQRSFFASLFETESTVAFRHRLLAFITEQFNIHLDEAHSRKNNEVLRNFMAMAVLGVLESYVLGHFSGGLEEVAGEVGALLEQLIVG